MSNLVDPELLSFTAQVLERRGGVVEQYDEYLNALVPEALSQQLEIPEEVQFGANGELLMYGHPLLERIIELATEKIPIVYGKLNVDYLKKDGFEHLLNQEYIFKNGKCRLVNRAETRASYMILICHYVAMSDERKEGFVQLAVQESSGAIITAFPERWKDFQPEFFDRKQIPPHFSTHLEPVLKAGLKYAKVITESQLKDFIESMRRHLNRDVRNTREYYEALENEMQLNLEKTNLSTAQRNERIEKIKEIPAEMERKIEDLQQKYRIQVKLTASAALRFLVPVVQLLCEVCFHKLRKEIRVYFNPITHQLDPVVCDCCRKSTYEMYFREKKSDVQLCCVNCVEGK